MNAARTTLGLWLLVQLLLSGLMGHGTPLSGGKTLAQAAGKQQQWHGDAAGHRHRADFLAERPLAKRAGGKPTDDALPGAGTTAPRPLPAATPRPAAQAIARAAHPPAPYSARAPPLPA